MWTCALTYLTLLFIAVPIIYDAAGHLISPFYGYLPTRSVCYVFGILFAISLGELDVQVTIYLLSCYGQFSISGRQFGIVLGGSFPLWSSLRLARF